MNPQIAISVGQPTRLDHAGSEVPERFQDVEISGNRQGLLRFAEIIQRVAESQQEGYHTHVYPDHVPQLLLGDGFSITISKSLSK